MKQDNTAHRKRTQIAKASQTMFLWITIASALVGAAVVVSIFLVQRISYTTDVLTEKSNTVNTLKHNLSVVDELKSNVRALDANSALLSVKANQGDETLQVVLDALPADANSLALGASLQNKLLSGVEGSYTIESLQVSPVEGVEAMSSGSVVDASGAGGADGAIQFSFSVRGSQSALRQILQNLERSIRTIVVTNLTLETQSRDVTLTVNGYAFYQPARSIELIEKTVPNK